MSVCQPKTIMISALPNKLSPATVSVSRLEMDDDLYTSDGTPRKRRRLTNLTSDQKLLRRKLKNRVAAQSARDRKKSLMTDLEDQVAKLMEENRKLATENNSLKAKSGKLFQQNEALKEQLSGCNMLPGKQDLGSGSAVSVVPLPKGQVPVKFRSMQQYVASLLTVSLTFLLACSNKREEANQKRVQVSPQSCQGIQLEVPAQHNPRVQWWGPQQQSWNPSMN